LLPYRRGGTDDRYDTRRWDGWEIVSHKVILDKYLVVGGIGGELVIVDLISGKVSVHSDECSWRSCVYAFSCWLRQQQVLRTCKLPGTWANNLALHVWQGQPRLIVCSNSFLETVQGALAKPPVGPQGSYQPAAAGSIFLSRYAGALAQVGVCPTARP
jgi:hypothetical protein